MRRMHARLAVAATTLALVGCGLSPVPLAEPVSAQKTEEPAQTQTYGEIEGADEEFLDVDGGAIVNMMAEESVVYDGALDDFNTEEYDVVEETGFVSTRTSPLSTVSADVDTASYANLRRMLLDGYTTLATADDTATPADDTDAEDMEDSYYDSYYYDEYRTVPKGAVRIEEMLNYFDYDYATPQGEDPFAITARVGPCPWNADTNLLVLGFATAPEATSVADNGSNLVFLIDVSGSMDMPDKLPLLQSSFAKLVEQLDEDDRVSIVTYSGEEEIVLEGESGANKREIMRAIRRLKAEGSTNGEAGLRMAYEIAEDNYISGGVNRIVMASDGDLNVGMTSESDLHDFVEEKREGGVYLSVLGFGEGNYKDNKMETLADHGNGSYHYIDCEEEAERVFGERLTANLVPFADDVKLQVEFNPAMIKGYRLIGYENRTMAAEDFEDDTKDAGEVGPNSQFTVAYEIVPVDSALEIAVPDLKYAQEGETTATSDEWLTAKLRYQPAAGGDVREQDMVVSAGNWQEDPGEDWRFAAAVTEFGMLLRDSDYRGTSTFDSIRELVGDTDDTLRLGFLDLVYCAETN